VLTSQASSNQTTYTTRVPSPTTNPQNKSLPCCVSVATPLLLAQTEQQRSPERRSSSPDCTARRRRRSDPFQHHIKGTFLAVVRLLSTT
jgi:hypothetical protein